MKTLFPTDPQNPKNPKFKAVQLDSAQTVRSAKPLETDLSAVPLV